MYYVMIQYVDRYGKAYYRRCGTMNKKVEDSIEFLNRHANPGTVEKYGTGTVYAKRS